MTAPNTHDCDAVLGYWRNGNGRCEPRTVTGEEAQPHLSHEDRSIYSCIAQGYFKGKGVAGDGSGLTQALMKVDFADLEKRVIANMAKKLTEKIVGEWVNCDIQGRALLEQLRQEPSTPKGLMVVSDLPTTARMGCPWRAE